VDRRWQQVYPRNLHSHKDLAKVHFKMARSMDKPASALVKDLKGPGLVGGHD
jgi:hypothetical protein